MAGSVLMKTVGTGQPSIGLDAPDDYDAGASYDDEIRRLQSQVAAKDKPRYTPEQVSARRDANDQLYMLGMMHSMTGDPQYAQLGGQILQKTMAAEAPRVTDQGEYDPTTGEYTMNAEARRAKLEDRLSVLTQTQAAAREKQQAAAQKAYEDRITKIDQARERGQYLEAIKAMGGAAGGGGAGGAITDAGYTPAGNRVVQDKQANRYEVDPTTGQRTPYNGVITPVGAFEKQAAAQQGNTEQLSNMQGLRAQVEGAPGAFGLMATATGMMPLRGLWGEKALTEDQRMARAQVLSQMSQVTHTLFGANFTHGEQQRAKEFVVGAEDNLPVALGKMRALEAEVQRRMQAAPQSVQGIVAQRQGKPAGGGQGGGRPTPTAADLAYLQAHPEARDKFIARFGAQ